MNLNELLNFFRSNGVSLIQSLLILIVGIVLVRLFNRLLKKIFLKSVLDNSITSFIISLINIILYVALIYIVFMLLGISTTGFIAALSAGALAIGLALQETLANLACGILIIMTKPFVQGDLVEVGSITGKIRQIRFFNTQLVTTDNKTVTIPNNKFINSEVINFTRRKNRRIEIKIPVAYGSDLEKVKSVILEAVNNNEGVLKHMKSTVRLMTYNDSSLDFILWCWCNTSTYWDTFFDLNESIYQALCENDITIPFNQMDLHIIENSEKKVVKNSNVSKQNTQSNNEKKIVNVIKQNIEVKKDVVKEVVNNKNDVVKEKNSNNSKNKNVKNKGDKR